MLYWSAYDNLWSYILLQSIDFEKYYKYLKILKILPVFHTNRLAEKLLFSWNICKSA